MSTGYTRRNDPCPCGSGKRFKDCHGLGGMTAPVAPASRPAAATPEDKLREAMAARGRGELERALVLFDEVLALYPGNAQVRAFRGLTLCNLDRFDEGLAEMRAARDAAPTDADLLCNLGVVYFALGRLDEAKQALEQSLAIQPRGADAMNNLGLVLRARGDLAGAEGKARAALEARPGFVQASFNLGLALLAQGRYAEGWPHYAERPGAMVNLRDPQLHAGLPHESALPDPAYKGKLVLHGEQGLGDTLFFLRFAGALTAWRGRMAFWGDERLFPLLARTGLFDSFIAAAGRPELSFRAPPWPVWVGDLPHLLARGGDPGFPPPLGLAADPARVARFRQALSTLGPAPYVGVAWRAGLPREGRIVLAKQVPVELLASALRAVDGTTIALQRAPETGEIARMAEGMGRPVHDFSSVNADLEDALAMLDVLDLQVGVSNTNVHLRAALGRRGHVLVPWPPEWRWPEATGDSPWFPACSVYRQGSDGNWRDAVARLGTDLRSLASTR
jgi:tetratricopeptide (TPR) repeat protein